MNTDRTHRHDSLDPLPSSFDAELVRVDALLAQEAASHDTPPGLADRVAHASAAHLPAAKPLRFADAPVVAVPARRLPALSRLAMAASLGLLLLVGIVFLRSPVAPSINGSGEIVLADPAVHVSPAVSTSRSLTAAQEWILLDSVQLAHFSELRSSSLSDMTDDLAQLVRELEM
jgi:hypothetical protein